MEKIEELESIVAELIDIVHEQTREMENVLVKIERAVGPLSADGRFSVLASELSELRLRLKHVAV